jgi:methyl-accepting chemotaxis protein
MVFRYHGRKKMTELTDAARGISQSIRDLTRTVEDLRRELREVNRWLDQQTNQLVGLTDAAESIEKAITACVSTYTEDGSEARTATAYFHVHPDHDDTAP